MKWLIPQHEGQTLIEWLKSQRNVDNAKTFFTPRLADLPDPFDIYGMREGVEFIIESIKANKRIYIHGDFDADGITATSIMWLFLSKYLKANILPYIPSRFYEGYGLTDESVGGIIEKGADVIITVDCGIKDIELVNKYSKIIDFVITDHHTPRSTGEDIQEFGKIVGNYQISSKAKAIIHPTISRKEGDVDICGAFVAFKICCAINTKLNLGVDMLEFADLCAIGTNCDVMPLLNENRSVVKLGLEQINLKKNVGLKALIFKSGIKEDNITAYHLGYVIGPRLNAAGRLGDAMDAVRLLTTSSEGNAKVIASKLEDLNLKRKDLTDEYFQLAEKQLNLNEKPKIFVYFGENWPEGLLGLIAGKLAEKYHRPVIIGTKSEVIKASARSPEFFNIIDFLSNYSDFLEKFGGHAQAAGLTVKEGRYNDFIKQIQLDSSNLEFSDSERILFLDGSLPNFSELSFENIEQLLKFEPFGNKNPKPVIHISNLKINKYSLIGKRNEHIKFDLVDSSSKRIEAISFGNSNYFTEFIANTNKKVEIATSVEIDIWNNIKKISLRLVDMRFM